jgi:hypothetical protein
MDHPAPAWTYQPPYRPASHPDQCYHGAAADGSTGHYIAPYDWNDDGAPRLTLFRFEHEDRARLTLAVEAGELRATLSSDQLFALRNACNDALADIAQAEADRERRESFDAISEELREADARGDGSSTGVLYAHPDVHYVAPDQVAAKVDELEAAGAPRYIVLAVDPALECEGAAA